MLKKLDIYNYTGATEKDNETLKFYMNNDIDLYVDEYGRVFTEADIYIADVIYTPENGIGIL